MKQDTTTSRRADRYTRLKKQLAQVRAELKRTKQERAAWQAQLDSIIERH